VPPALNDKLSSVLACPTCHGQLSTLVGSTGLHCARCQATYGIRQDVPRFCDGIKNRDEKLAAEWEAQHNAGPHYTNPIIIMNRWEEEQVLPHILDKISNVEGLVLDAGCGVGHLGQSFVRLGRRGIDLIGMDFQEELLANVTVGYTGVVEGDIHQLPFKDGAFQAVLTSNALHHFPDPRRAMVEIARVLAPGGVFVCYDPRFITPLEMVKKFLRRNDTLFTKDHKSFRVDEYRELIGSSGLEVTEVRTVDALGPLVATGLDYLKVGRLGVGPQIARVLAAADRLIEGSRGESPFGLMLVGRAVKSENREKRS
jgi:SAM-dependent methyltransferase